MATVLDEAVSNVNLALFHVRRLASFSGLNPQSLIDAALRPLLPDPFQSVYVAPTLVFPGFYYGGNNQRKIIYLAGATNQSHALRYVEGLNFGTGNTGLIPVNPFLDEAATWVLSNISASHFVDPEHLDIVGYSLGGAVGTIIRDKFLTAQSLFKTKLITFGAPRAGSTFLRQRLGNVAIARWMTDQDPVPLVPPRATDAPVLIALQSVVTMLRWGNYVHTDGGIEVAQNGVTTPTVLPSVASINPGSSLANWFFGAEYDPNNRHLLSSYDAFLNAAAATLTTPSVQDVDVGPAEQVQEGDRKDMTRRQRQVVNVINAAGRAQNAVPQVTPDTVLFEPIRQGRIWYVAFGGQIVMTAPIEKRARHICRAANDFLRSMQKQAVVDPVSLLSQMEVFLQMAASPETGFVPTINTSINV